MNYFFYAGGRVLLNFSKSSTGQPADAAWNALATACNQITFTSTATSKVIATVTYTGTTKQGGSGTPSIVATYTGMAQLTGVNQTIFQQNSTTYPYTGDYIKVEALITGSTIQFTTTWFAAAGSLSYKNQQISAGAVTAISYYPPETTYISNTWGTPTLAASVV